MRKTLLFSGFVLLLTTTGCLVTEGGHHGGHHGHGHYKTHSEVIVGPPVLVVRPP